VHVVLAVADATPVVSTSHATKSAGAGDGDPSRPAAPAADSTLETVDLSAEVKVAPAPDLKVAPHQSFFGKPRI
jgi:hypothetical protein